MRQLVQQLFLAYLRIGAQLQLFKIRPKYIVGITGSAGKTTCKEGVYAILSDKHRTKAGKKSQNSEIGLPMDILDIEQDYDSIVDMFLRTALLVPFKLLTNWSRYEVYIAEMGVDKPGDMNYLLKFVHPDIGVFLNALPVHTANFPGGIKDIAKEKGKLIESLPQSGTAVLNADDENVLDFKSKTKAKVVTIGKNAEIIPFTVNLPGYLLTDEQGYTLAAAAAVGKAFGISLAESKKLLSRNLKLPPGRMSVLPGIKKSIIIDSSYNASPVPMIAALRALEDHSGNRKMAVLGDMRELGERAKDDHARVAKVALEVTDQIFTFGPLTEEYFPKDKKIQNFRKMPELISAVKEFLKPGDTVLVKGSQNTILLETLVEKILANSHDVVRLCRRGRFWDIKRNALLNS